MDIFREELLVKKILIDDEQKLIHRWKQFLHALAVLTSLENELEKEGINPSLEEKERTKTNLRKLREELWDEMAGMLKDSKHLVKHLQYQERLQQRRDKAA